MASDHDRRDKLIRFGDGLRDGIEARMSLQSAYLEDQLRHISEQHRTQRSYDTQCRQARLAKIIEDFLADGCPLDGETCQDVAGHLADEIISRG